jgi:hypothetical protein
VKSFKRAHRPDALLTVLELVQFPDNSTKSAYTVLKHSRNVFTPSSALRRERVVSETRVSVLVECAFF